ncbi:hypothetical protein DS901_06505 [Loktanella sp. D2R18]|uniref:hypothetical protein n=1 Tax=Rhodobacterales TaxID=204455 RepID=UPI000DE95B90|nr:MULTISPECIES: hypothetical protein [Rhodobacterales]MDO6591831.1 hypothetical protein [Yoonia sp. 1_MG-2023]RBW44870.1 hypothetical protein DS901_06505 [Loktanella sp. D2R18]
MAKSMLSVTMRAIKAAERERVRQAKSANRAYNAELKEQVLAAQARERQLKQAVVENNKEKVAKEKAVKAAHIVSQLAEVEILNAKIDDVFGELDGLLEATLDVDDFIDLEALRKPSSCAFDKPELLISIKPPIKPRMPTEPEYREPPRPKGLFGKKKKHEQAKLEALETHSRKKEDWVLSTARLQSEYDSSLAQHALAEEKRIEELALEKERFQQRLNQHNRNVDQFINDLAYGDAEAVQDYVAMVAENSNYPDHFVTTHEFLFRPEDAELQMEVAIPSPNDFPCIKAYKYVKTSDEIRETLLSKAELRKRYCSAVYQVAVRSLHEVFEADRREIIQTISLVVGTNEGNPATGKVGIIPFVGVSAARSSFMEFDLAKVVPEATLKHLGAAISKDPVSLVAADVSGVRKS